MDSSAPSSEMLITQPISRIHASIASRPAAASSSVVRPSGETPHTLVAKRANFSRPYGMTRR